MKSSVIGKSYDIRGIYPVDIDEETYYKIGYAYAKLIEGEGSFVIGKDSRLSSDSLALAFMQGIVDGGGKVVDLGLCSTDMVYFATGAYDYVKAGIMITASHNPKEYNGIKSCLKNAVPINMKDFGIKIIEFNQNNDIKYVRNDFFTENEYYEKRDVSDDFVEHVASFAGTSITGTKRYKVVADAGNGVAGVFFGKLAKKMGFDLEEMFFEPDGNFPNHHPSPIEPENVSQMIERVKSIGADLGVAFDGDADRMYICDENGEIWSGTITTAIISEMILKINPGKKVAYNGVCGRIVSETIINSGGIPVKTKVGHVYIKEAMKDDEDIVFAGEHSGHYYFRNNWNADSGAIAFASVFGLILRSGLKPSLIMERYNKRFSIPETNFKVSNTKKKIEELKKEFSDGEIDEMDGLTLSYPDFWFNVRPSSNEPLLRLNLESDSYENLNKKMEAILALISG